MREEVDGVEWRMLCCERSVCVNLRDSFSGYVFVNFNLMDHVTCVERSITLLALNCLTCVEQATT